MKRVSIAFPIMILVAVLAMWMLNRDYSEIEFYMRIIIAVGAALLSGILSIFLFGFDKKKG